jgi:hypothetical protein
MMRFQINYVLKSCAQYISKPLVYIYNIAINLGSFPDHLKYSVVVPVYKNGDKSLIANYRPISLLPGFSRIYEILIYRRLTQHIQCNNIIVPDHFGFRKGLSTDNATYKLIDTVFHAWTSKKCIAGVFHDLSKVFDCVNYELLKRKLGLYGVKGVLLNWCSSYLDHKKQRVDLKLP